MGVYVLLSSLTDEGARTLSEKPERIKEVNREVEELGAKVIAQYATLGRFDFLNLVEAPDDETIARVSIALSSRGTVKIETLTAIPIDRFAKRLGARA
jgi:uncharacterized protein with GYD domain